MPNGFAYLALIVWPVFAFGLFRSLPLERALIWSTLGAYLMLPPVAKLDLPLIPALDKVTIPNLAAFLICVLVLGKRVSLIPASSAGRALMVLFVVSPAATVFTNPAPIFYGPTVLPGLRAHDLIALVINQGLALLPFFLARSLLWSAAAQREILLAMVAGGLAYSVPMLLEVRLSPQLNTWIYGFFQHSFDQMMRQGGFRPIVFLEHGLLVAFFAMSAFVAALALARAERRAILFGAVGYLGLVLVLCKSLGALLYAVALAPLALFASRTLQLRVAAALALVTLAYPMLRGAELVPVRAMLAQAEQVSAERAQSLGFRFENEEALLARARERPLFGWGSWGRNQIFDPTSGEMTSVTDGRWIIVIGVYGWCGYVAEFGMLALPLLLLVRHARRGGDGASPFAGPLALLLAINMIDLLPNASLTPLTWMIAGALLGHAEALSAGRAGTGSIPAGLGARPAERGASEAPGRRRPIL